MVTFDDRLENGKAGESAIAQWLIRKGYGVLPAYEIQGGQYKGPHVRLPEGDFITPDLLVWKGRKVLWVEAKHKSAFTWHRLTERWTTGIDRRHYYEYLKVFEWTPFDVWILFLQQGKDESPTGLFGRKLSYLRDHVNHQSDKWGPSGMIYWAQEHLQFLATAEEVMNS